MDYRSKNNCLIMQKMAFLANMKEAAIEEESKRANSLVGRL
jgi:hypothetical protein